MSETASEAVTGPVHPESERWGGWTWSDPKRGEHFRRCSYCGSINPDDLASEPTWLAEWADRKYGWPHKFYVDIPNQQPDVPVPMGSSSEPSDGPGWINVEDMTDEQKASLTEHGWGGSNPYGSYLFAPKPTHHAKFYTVHLSDPRLDPTIKERIETVSGLSFTFEDGKVGWAPTIRPVP